MLSSEQIEEVLPEDGVPDDLHFRDIDENLPVAGLSKLDFVDWMTEGRHDCDVARALGLVWTHHLQGGANESLEDFLERLVCECRDFDINMGKEDDDLPEQGGVTCGRRETMGSALSLVWLAAFVLEHCSPVSFRVEGETEADRVQFVADLVAVEVDCVRGYVRTWRGTGAVGAREPTNVADTLREHVADVVHPWPSISEEPHPERADGRFVKAFPLEFPMGQGDPRQPRLRSDFRIADAVQHLLRYETGHLLRANRGHRVVWALFNTSLREQAYERGSLVHKNSQQLVLTKEELRKLFETRQDLVQRVASCGADVPTTSMHWKREATNLQWIVRQMCWYPPWVAASSLPQETERTKRAYGRRNETEECRDENSDDVAGVDAGVVLPVGSPASGVGSGDDCSTGGKNTETGRLRRFAPTSDSETLGGTGGEGAPFVAADRTGAVDPRALWSVAASHQLDDTYGYGRIPGFWFTLNLPYNYLYDIHRFQRATRQLVAGVASPGDVDEPMLDVLDPESREAMEARCGWALDNPDIVVTMHAIRVEVTTRYVMREIVPPEQLQPFLFWLRFEFGKGGNPHAHGLCYVPGNPEFDLVVKDLATLQRMLAKGGQHPQDKDLRTYAEAQQQVAAFYDAYIRERHPCKDVNGAALWNFAEPLYTLLVEGVRFPGMAKPQTVNLKELLEEVFPKDPAVPEREPDTSKLKYLVLALIESGQRHTGHGHGLPRPEDPCARVDVTPC